MGQDQSRHVFNFVIVSALEGKHLLDEAESIDGYRLSISQKELDSKARKDHNYFPLADSQINREQMQTWLDDVKRRLGEWEHTKWLVEFFGSRDASIFLVNMQFSADGGMPHTRPLRGNRGLICVPGGLRGADWEIKTIVHELIHVAQRMNWVNWAKLYKKHWFMDEYTGQIPIKYERALRYNPDTISNRTFIYKGKWVPLCIYADVTAPDIHHTSVVYFNTQTGVVWFQLPNELANDPIFGDKKIMDAMREHPNELSAWILAEPHRFDDTWVSQQFPTLK